jgi:hypothetical protein
MQAANKEFLRKAKDCTKVGRIRNEKIRNGLQIVSLIAKVRDYRQINGARAGNVW